MKIKIFKLVADEDWDMKTHKVDKGNNSLPTS